MRPEVVEEAAARGNQAHSLAWTKNRDALRLSWKKKKKVVVRANELG